MFTAKNLKLSEIQTHHSNGDFERLYLNSKPYIAAGNYQYDYYRNGDISNDEFNAAYSAGDDAYFIKYWYKHNSGYTGGRGENNYLTAVYEDGYLLTLECVFYDPSDKSITICNGLVGPNTSNSKEYIYNVEWQNARVSLWKSLGAIKSKAITHKNSPMKASYGRVKHAGLQQTGSLVDWNSQSITELTKEYIYYDRDDPGVADHIPTMDGSTKPDTPIPEKQVENTYTVVYEVVTTNYL